MEILTREHITKYYKRKITKDEFRELQLKINLDFVEKILI